MRTTQSQDSPDLNILPILLGEVFGPTAVIGTARRELLPHIAAAASELQILATKSVATAISEELGDLLAAPLRRLDPRVEESATSNRDAKRRRARAKNKNVDGELASLVVLGDPPEGELMAQIEKNFGRLVHDGVFLIDAVMTPNAKRRLLRMLETVVDEFRWLGDAGDSPDSNLPVDGNKFRVCGWGRRHAPGKEPAFATQAPASLTAVVYARGNPDEVNPLVVDLLFRQNTPPSLVLILDDALADSEEESVPTDLWGMATFAETQPALLTTGGVGRGAAYAEALEHIETDYIVFYEGHERLVPNHTGVMAAALDDREDWVAAASRVLALGQDGRAKGLTPALGSREKSRTCGLLERGGLAPAAMVVRSGALRELGFDPELQHRPLRQLELKLSQLGLFGDLPLALSLTTRNPTPANPAELDEERRIVEEFNRSCELAKLAAGREGETQTERLEMAQMLLAQTLERVGSLDQALSRYSAVVKERPEAEEARLAAASLMLKKGQFDKAKTWVGAESSASNPPSWRLRLAIATARALSGDSEVALAELETLISEQPSNPVAHWNRLALFAAAEKSGGMKKALRDCERQSLGIRAHSDGGFLLTNFASVAREGGEGSGR